MHTCSWIWLDMRWLYCIFGLTNHYIKSHLSVKSWYNYFCLFIWMKFTYELKWCESWKLRLEWRMTPWWQHYDTLPAGFDRVPPRHVTVLSCVSNPSQHTHTTHTYTHYIPLRPSLTCHSSMPRRPIRRCLMRHSVTHLRMHDKVLLDFPVATVCSLLSLLNTHERVHTCSQPQHTFICDRGGMSKAIKSAVGEMLRIWLRRQCLWFIYSC